MFVPAVKYDLNDVRKHAKLNKMNNVATVFVFFTVLINIFITALGFEGQVVRYARTRTRVISVLLVSDVVLLCPGH